MAFDPNRASLASCMERLRQLQKEYNIDPKTIITSRDKIVKKLLETELLVKNVPDGFHKTILPVFFDKPSTLYISSGAPGTVVPKHSHDEGDGIRFMISGSISYGKRTLRQGDWMFIPAGVPYEFEVGPLGASMAYCYCCCCA